MKKPFRAQEKSADRRQKNMKKKEKRVIHLDDFHFVVALKLDFLVTKRRT